MKKSIFFLISILLSLSICSNAQTGSAARITWPVEGAIFQQGESGNLDVQFAGQLGYGLENISTYKISIKTLESQICPGTCSTYVLSTLDYSSNWNTSLTEFKSFKASQNLPKGWYEATLSLPLNLGPFGILNIPFHKIKFGVGDVYFIAGQSNASGYITIDDNVQNYAQTFPANDQRESIRIINSPDDFSFGTINLQGLPFNSNFSNFKNGDGINKFRIYPNGRDSWYWAQFAHRMTKDKKTPVLLFNLATPDRSMEQWSSTDPNLLKQLRRSLQTYGNILGAKAVLWHQGENDTRDLRTTIIPHSSYLSTYTTRLNGLIATSRSSITINGSDMLSWYVSKVSHHYAADGWTVTNPINPLSPDPTISTLNCSALRSDITKKMVSADLKNAQTNNTNNNVFLGVDSDIIDECSRAKMQIIHFTGNNNGLSTNSLLTMGDNWYNAVNNNYSAKSVKRQELLPITITKDNGTGNYTLTGPSGYAQYYWVQNSNSVYAGNYLNVSGSTSNANCVISTGTQSSINYYICYVTNDTNIETAKFQVCHPFVMKNTLDAAKGLKLKLNTTEISTLSFNQNPEQKAITVESTNVIWDSADKPSWIDLGTVAGGFGETFLSISTNQTNSTGTNRSATLRIKENGTTNSFQKTLTITQAATTACTTTNLSSITADNISQPDFGTLHYNQSVSGGSLNVGSYSTNYGLGTHANSNLKYNIGGNGFVTFSGSVGRDNASDNCNCGTQKVQFIIKADGVTLFTSNLLGTTDERQAFQVSVANRNQLELIVNDGGDNFWGDHADWMDVILECGTPPGCTNPNPPTAITSICNAPVTPNTSCNLQTTCASGTTATWNTGQTGNSITVAPGSTTTYSVKCVSGVCESSSVSKTVEVIQGSCSAVVDGLVMGTWNVTGQQLKVRYFDNKYWLTQVVTTNPDAFVVRGSVMLQRSDVTLNNGSYSGLTTCFYYVDGGLGGLTTPTNFITPAGYSLLYSGGTPYYQATGNPPSCTNTDLTNNWYYASSDVNPPPKINANQSGTAININGTSYTKGIGTHAFSEIIYDLGTTHNFEYFKADVGRDLKHV